MLDVAGVPEEHLISQPNDEAPLDAFSRAVFAVADRVGPAVSVWRASPRDEDRAALALVSPRCITAGGPEAEQVAQVVRSAVLRDTKMQAHAADECWANALRCVEVAQHASTLDDRSGFLSFAEVWYKLANEIDYTDRLIAFIDALDASEPMRDTVPEEIDSGIRSLRRLTAAIVTISTCFMADQLAHDASEGDL